MSKTSSYPIAFIISSAFETDEAPSKSNAFGPADIAENMDPGTAPISRLYSRASLAVTLVPETLVDCTIPVISPKSLTILLFLDRNVCFIGLDFASCSDIKHPLLSSILCASAKLVRGYITESSSPEKAIVWQVRIQVHTCERESQYNSKSETNN